MLCYVKKCLGLHKISFPRLDFCYLLERRHTNCEIYTKRVMLNYERVNNQEK